MKKADVLTGITVIDNGRGMAATLVTKMLAEMGANIIRVNRQADEVFRKLYPAYDAWQEGVNKLPEGITDGELERILSEADVYLTGGEDHPSVTSESKADEVAVRFPQLVILKIESNPEGLSGKDMPATELLAQARSGLCFEHFSDRPVMMSFSPTNMGTTFHALTGLLSALFERNRSGKGQHVCTSLLEGAMTWNVSYWCDIEKATPANSFIMPKAPTALIFKCSDGKFIHIVMGSAGSKYKIYQALEIDDPNVKPGDSGMPKPTANPRNFFGEYDLLAAHAAKLPSDVILARIWEHGLPAEPVLPPGGCWELPQIKHNRIIRENSKGEQYVGLPYTFATNPASYQASGQGGDLPLSGVRVVDLGTFVAGPSAAAILSDFGAEVIKVETHHGDPQRSLFVCFASVNHGKKSIVIDLKNPQGLDVLKSICKTADVVMSNFRPGVAERLGIDPASLHAIKPELIVMENPGYGASGPTATRGGFDMVMQALCGHEFQFGGEGNEPLWNRSSMVDYAAGWLGAIAIISALLKRDASDNGVAVVSPLLNAAIYLGSEVIKRSNGLFEGGNALNRARTGFNPCEALYQTRDGWVAVVIRDEAQARGLIDLLELQGSVSVAFESWGDPEYQAITAVTIGYKTEMLMEKLRKGSVWCEQCVEDGKSEFLNSPVYSSANIAREYRHPEFGVVKELGSMVRFSRSRVKSDMPPPGLGEHTRQILAEIGMDESVITELSDNKVVA